MDQKFYERDAVTVAKDLGHPALSLLMKLTQSAAPVTPATAATPSMSRH